MDGAGDDRLGWTLDGLAAATLGAAVGACLWLLGAALAGVIAAAVTSLVALAGLRQVKPGPRRFTLPAFGLGREEVSGLFLMFEQSSAEELLLTERVGDDEDELLLTDALAEAAADSRVVKLFAVRPLPTPGELQQRIAAHLASAERPAEADGGKVLQLEVDAAAALRQSLHELRRGLA